MTYQISTPKNSVKYNGDSIVLTKERSFDDMPNTLSERTKSKRRKTVLLVMAILGIALSVGIGGRVAASTLTPVTYSIAFSRNLPAGHVIVPRDIQPLTLSASPKQELTLVPVSLRGLVVGEVLKHSVIAGSVIHTFDIQPISSTAKIPTAPSSANCAPAP